MAQRPAVSVFSQAKPKYSVVGFVLDQIKTAITRGELKPGDLLPSETEMSNSLGVGKTSVREAIKMLQAVGAVDIRQGHGTVLRTEPGADILTPLVFQLLLKDGTPAELLEFRQLIEPGYSLLAQRKASDEDMKNLELSVVTLERKVAAGTQSADDDLAFHRVILEATHNPYMIAIGNTVLELFRSSIEKSMRDIPWVAATDHREIFQAFRSRNPDALLTAIQQSYEGWTRSLKAQSSSGV